MHYNAQLHYTQLNNNIIIRFKTNVRPNVVCLVDHSVLLIKLWTTSDDSLVMKQFVLLSWPEESGPPDFWTP